MHLFILLEFSLIVCLVQISAAMKYHLNSENDNYFYSNVSYFIWIGVFELQII